jgi:hypothetical protein
MAHLLKPELVAEVIGLLRDLIAIPSFSKEEEKNSRTHLPVFRGEVNCGF